jgi:hypothetical protein
MHCEGGGDYSYIIAFTLDIGLHTIWAMRALKVRRRGA